MRFAPSFLTLAVGFSLMLPFQSRAQTSQKPLSKQSEVRPDMSIQATPDGIFSVPQASGVSAEPQTLQLKNESADAPKMLATEPASKVSRSGIPLFTPAAEPSEPATTTRKIKKNKRKTTRRERRSR